MQKKEYKIFDLLTCSSFCKSCVAYESKNLEPTFILTKKKVYSHYIPPDMTAVKMLAEYVPDTESLSDKSEAELQKIKIDLLAELNSLEVPKMLGERNQTIVCTAKLKQKKKNKYLSKRGVL